MSYRKCEWCGQYLRDYTAKCPSCGENNANPTAKEDLILKFSSVNELIIRIKNISRSKQDLNKLSKMNKYDLINLYHELKKDKKRCE